MSGGVRRVFIDAVDADRALAEAIASAVRARGALVSPALDATVTLVLRTPGAEALRAMLGDHAHTFNARVRVIGRAEDVAALELTDELTTQSASDASAQTPWRSALAHLSTSADEATLGALLVDPRCVSSHDRRAIVARLATLGTPSALEWLCASLRAHRGTLGADEAAALGRAFAQGASRWSVDSPFVIELDDLRDELSFAELALFKNAGTYVRLCDERGAAVHRALVDELPWIDGDDAATSVTALLRAMEQHASARVWIRGCVLPAAMPWTIWTTLLGQRARR
ncbi:MAG: hypothetical protein JNK05_17720 [Myxococcales bacterium]|nr:hypothetical protein [Myxococcales bacterium]